MTKALAKQLSKATTAQELRSIAASLIALADGMEDTKFTEMQVAIMQAVGASSILATDLPFDKNAIQTLVSEGHLLIIFDRGKMKYMRK